MNNPTEKQKCIAEQAVYGDLKAINSVANEIVSIAWMQQKSIYVRNEAGNDSYYAHPAEIKPILRPLSDITKEITHRGYNDDKPFIPIVELAKTQYDNFKLDSIEILDKRSIMCRGYNIKENVKYNCCYWFYPMSTRRTDEERDLLHLLHFDTHNLIETGDAISTDDIINPYSV